MAIMRFNQVNFVCLWLNLQTATTVVVQYKSLQQISESNKCENQIIGDESGFRWF